MGIEIKKAIDQITNDALVERLLRDERIMDEINRGIEEAILEFDFEAAAKKGARDALQLGMSSQLAFAGISDKLVGILPEDFTGVPQDVKPSQK